MISNPKIKISKLDAAKRQLETAILLYFNNADPVSIHTLIGAAHGLLANLIEARGGQSLMKLIIKDQVRKENQKKVAKKFTLAREHFKHANQNPDFVIDFYPSYNDFCLYDACIMYFTLTSEQVPNLEVFTYWFLVNNQDLFNSPPEDKKLFGNIKKEFEACKESKMDFFTQALKARSLLRR